MAACVLQYDLARDGYDTWGIPVLALVAAGGAGAIYAFFSLLKVTPLRTTRSMLFAALGCLILSAVNFVLTYTDYAILRDAYHRGHYREVSGEVENFVDGGPGIQPGTERFSVGGISFSYSKYIVVPGFRTTRASGGPLRQGLLVRIRYMDTAIVRLETCDSLSRNSI
jgi:hypothetical protein